MVRKKNMKQQELINPIWYMGERRQRMIVQSWAGLFRTEIMPCLPVDKMARCYQTGQGRPTKELHALLGALLLQQQFDLTDEETVEQYTCNLKWHYALRLDGDESDSEKYLCERTLWAGRQKVIAKGLDTELFYAVLERLRQVFPVGCEKQRLDSVHVSSNMKRLGRVRLFSRTIGVFLRELRKEGGGPWEKLPAGLVERYLSRESEQVFSQVKPSEAEAKLQDLANDLTLLLSHYEGEPAVTRRRGYLLMQRLYHDQCRPAQDEGPVWVKKAGAISGSSLQNPSDPDAGYSGHKGQGYSAQIMETYQTEKAPEIPNLITYAEVTSADQHDSRALMGALETAQAQGVAPAEVLADSLYGSDENCEAAKALGVVMVSPIMSPVKRTGFQLSDFESDETGHITRCPAGQTARICREGKKGRHLTALFDKAVCEQCSRQEECPVKVCRRVARLAYTKHGLKSSLRRAMEQGPAFKQKYRYRSGVEATMSVLDRLTGIKRQRVRGLLRVRYCVKLKAAGLNILRAAAAKAAGNLKQTVLAIKTVRQNWSWPRFFGLCRRFATIGILAQKKSGPQGWVVKMGTFAIAAAA
jgi:hypothetical protein